MSLNLSEDEIHRRLTRLRNLERLYANSREQVGSLRPENKKLSRKVEAQAVTIQSLKAQVDELTKAITKLTDSSHRYRFYLFGKGKKDGNGKDKDKNKDNNSDDNDKKKPRKPADRSSDSYRRPLPSENEITARDTLELTICPNCDGEVSSSVEQFKHYVEDIVFTPKTVIEYTVNRHWCCSCNKLVRPAVPDCLPGMRLGLNTVLLVLVEHYRSRKTDEQIVDSLQRYFGLTVSEGEISNIRHGAANYFGDKYDDILKTIRSARVIYADETGWHILS
jgi:transposase